MVNTVSILVLVTIALASPTQHQIPDTLFSNNYQGFRAYVEGFMSGFTGTTYVLGSDCLSEVAQTRLDGEVIAVFSALIRAKFEDFFDGLNTLTNDFGTIAGLCGLTQVETALNYDLKTKGIVHLIMNGLWHFVEWEADLLESLGDLIVGDYQNAGMRLGEAVAFIIEPAPTEVLRRMRLGAVNPSNIEILIAGFYSGIQADPTKPSTCAVDF
jgi:hypothetical protein